MRQVDRVFRLLYLFISLFPCPKLTQETRRRFISHSWVVVLFTEVQIEPGLLPIVAMAGRRDTKLTEEAQVWDKDGGVVTHGWSLFRLETA
jgi:hypothetical protein